MSYHQVFHELLVDAVVLVGIILFQILNQLLKHLFQHNKFNFVDGCQNLDGDCFVNWQHLLDCWGAISA